MTTRALIELDEIADDDLEAAADYYDRWVNNAMYPIGCMAVDGTVRHDH